MSQQQTSFHPRARRWGPVHRFVVGLLAAVTGLFGATWVGLQSSPAAASTTATTAVAAQEQQVLTWTAGNSVSEYLTAPDGAVAGTASVIFDNSVAAGNTSGMPHTLTFDTTTPGYNHDVDLNITANPFDANGGYYEAEITLTPGTYRYFCSFPGHGMMWGELVVTDDGGGEPGEDTTAPEVAAEVAGEQDDSGAFLGSAEVTITATDADSGVESVEYSLDGGEFAAYEGPVSVSEPGEHTVDFRATDVAGNTAEDSVSFAVVEGDTDPGDTVAPEVTAEVAGEQDDSGAYVGSAEVTITATDADSGVESVEYSLDGGEFAAYEGPVSVSEPGEHTVDFRATDVAGNTAEDSVSFTVVEGDTDPGDTVAPEVVAEVAGEQDGEGAYVGSAEVTITATDADSGVEAVEYSLDGGEFAAYEGPVSVSEPGEHTVDFRATDVAGNTAEDSVSFTVVEGDTDPGECPDTRETVIIDGVDTGVANADLGDGCTINDLIDEDGDHASHGAFVRHVDAVVAPLADDGVITPRAADTILRTAVASDIGK